MRSELLLALADAHPDQLAVRAHFGVDHPGLVELKLEEREQFELTAQQAGAAT